MIRNFLLIAVVSTLVACRTVYSGMDSLKHDLGDPASFGAFDYVELTHDEYIKTARGPFLPESHPLVIYSQSLVDHFDHLIRARNPTEMSGVPRPRIAVRKTGEVGAFTMDRRGLCYDVPVRITEGIPVRPDTKLQALLPSAGKIAPAQFISCWAKVPVAPSEREAFARWFSKRFSPCEMTYKPLPSNDSADSGLALSGPCREVDFFPRKSVAGGLVVEVAPNRLLLFSGTFTVLESEDEMVAVVAHELAHYYRAHVAGVRRYDYCYRISPENHGHRPLPDPSMDDLCGRLRPRIGFSVDEATERRMGYYTIEQEADEIALEFLAMAGIPPTAAVDAWFKLSRDLAADSMAKPAIPMEECLRLRQNGWRDDKGRDIFVPVGDYRESHHSWCYRIRNIDAEIAAHAYATGPRSLPVADWSRIQQQARSL